MTQSRLTIVISGMIAANPHQGGATWAVLQYVLGFRQLGHNVYFMEPFNPKAPEESRPLWTASANADYFREVVSEFGLDGHAALLRSGTWETVGLSYDRLLDVASRADLIVNISGMLTDQALLEQIPVRAYLDLDPGFVQVWHEQGIDMRLAGHTHFVTVGQAIGSPHCSIPTCGRQWITTWQPVLLEHWPMAGPITHDGLTTIGHWRGYGSVQHQGVVYGQKVHSFRQFMALPTMTCERFMPALAIHPEEASDLQTLAANGWQLLDPAVVAGSPARYREFIQGSKAEIGIAKSGYVVSQSGWFSDRSACYLASGRPVIAQDTGFSRYLPTDAGLLAFDDIEGALAAIESINRDYLHHRRAARALAEEFFDSDRVLNRLLRSIGVAS